MQEIERDHVDDIEEREHGRVGDGRAGAAAVLDQAENAFGRDDDAVDDQQSHDQEIDCRGDGNGRDLLQRAEQDRADQRAEPAGGAADHRHGDRVDGVVERKGGGRLQVADVVGERRAGRAHQRAGDRGRDQLEPQRRHAGGFRRQFVIADRGKTVAEPGALDHARGGDRDHCEREHQEEEVVHVVADDRDAWRPDHIGPARAADIGPVHDQRLQHDGHRQRRDREEGAAQAQCQVAHAESDNAGDHGSDRDQRRDRQRIKLVQEHRTVGAECEERRRAEIYVAGVAAENIPGGRQYDVLQHHVSREEQVVVADRPQEGEHDGGAGGADQEKQWGAHVASSYRPNNPAGRNANVSSSTPNATAGDQDGP